MFLKIFPNFIWIFFWIFELLRQFSMFNDFVINFDFKNDWVTNILKFRLWINLQKFSTYMWQIVPKSKFSFLKSKFMKKSVHIENWLASSKIQKIFKNRRFLIIEKIYFLKLPIFKEFLRNLPNFFLEIFLHFWTREAILNIYWFCHKFWL